MATIVPQLTALSTDPGNGACLFFYNARNIFYPAGVGSSLGYTNYNGPLAFNSSTTTLRMEATSGNATVNGIRGAYVGVGLDVKGDFSTTSNGKTGSRVLGTQFNIISSCPITGNSPNTICVRMGDDEHYKIHTVTSNLTSYPLTTFPNNEKYTDTPPTTLHQYVSSVSDVTFKTVKVSLLNNGRVLRVDIKNNADGTFYPYLITQINSNGLRIGDPLYEDPELLGVGLAFSTSSSVTNCDVKNFSIHAIHHNLDRATDTVTPFAAPRFTANYTHPSC